MLFVYLLLLFASASAKSYPHRWYDLELADLYFEDFKNTHDRHYESAEEHNKRFEIFKQSLIRINENNLRQKLYTSGITKFSDMSQEEFKRMYTGVRVTKNVPTVEFVNDVEDVPDSFDWRDKDMVSPVKDQGKCLADWAFTVTGLMESAALMQAGSQISVSEQQILDCVYMGKGCEGGPSYDAVLYVNSIKGIESEKDYPYTASKNPCNYNESKAVLGINNYELFLANHDDDIKAALYKLGPLAFKMQEGDLYEYKSGILDCVDKIDGQIYVLLVGYGSENGHDYWIVKNSWGTDFGEKGYFRMKRGGNTCKFYNEHFIHVQILNQL